MEKKKNESPKPTPLPSNTITNPNQLRTRDCRQSKKNVSSNPKFMEQDPQDGNVDNINVYLGFLII